MRTLLFGLVFWAGINEALLVAITTLVGSNELAARQSGHPFLPSEVAIAMSVFMAFAITLGKHITAWTESLRKIVAERDAELKKTPPPPPGTDAPVGTAIVGLLIVVALLLCGCETVPRTVIAYDPVKHSFVLESPKDLDMEDLKISVFPATATNTMKIELSIGHYTSKNNIEVIQAIAARNAETRERIEAGSKEMLGDVIDLMK